MWYIFALLSGLFAAFLAITLRLHLQTFSPLILTIIFYVFSLIVLIPVALFSKKLSFHLINQLTHKDWLFLIIGSALNCMAFLFYLYALKCGKTCSVVALDRLSILFVVILSFAFLNEPFTYKSIIGSILMILGAALLSA